MPCHAGRPWLISHSSICKDCAYHHIPTIIWNADPEGYTM